MPSAPDRSPTDSTPSGRSIFSRITSPFSSKARNFAEFCIELDDPHKQYSPGDFVTGHVRLRVIRPIRVTHLVVCLHGFVQVYKNPGSPGESFRANKEYLGTGKGSKSGEYFGNGFASLFEDELVLCGDGRLADGKYQFNFELEFPDRDLPSSIDFERGTVTYMVTATMTRPTSISATMSCDRKVYFVERIDIAPLIPPKPRPITLEAVSRRSRARRLVDTSEKRSRKTNSAEHGSEAPRQSETSSARSSQGGSRTPDSPVQSEISFDSRLSSHEQASHSESQVRASPSTSDGDRGNASKSSFTTKVITATIETQAGGCLRGDSIPVKVNVFHTKHIRSVYGVIVTLYRQARVDLHPSIPLGPTEKGKDKKYEEYYPKSVTGLGGLSLTGAGSSHIFRKDMAQVLAPLIIDPQTLTTEVNTRVRVPEEAFPTISTVPGAMISFKYYVEVVLDIQGRLAGSERTFTSLSSHIPLPGHPSNVDGSDMERSAFTPFGSTIIDTTPIRRDKSVVTSTFEVIIGTVDSERRKGKGKVVDEAPEPESSQHQAQPELEEVQQEAGAEAGGGWYDPNLYYDPRWYEQSSYWYSHGYFGTEHPYEATAHHNYAQPPPPPPPPVSIPEMPDESQMTEKERIRHAETRLLPSQPPGSDFEQAIDGPEGATAPHLSEEDGVAKLWHPASGMAPGSTAHSPGQGEGSQQRQISVVPEYEPPEAGPSTRMVAPAVDDKREMERHQLQSQVSAPPPDLEAAEALPATEHGPTAPTLDEAEGIQDANDSHADAFGSFGLPRYER